MKPAAAMRRHEIVVEAIEDDVSGAPIRCLAGERACPPEDFGGPYRYPDLLEALRDPEHEEHERLRRWAGVDFDPEAVDLAAVNRALGRLR